MILQLAWNPGSFQMIMRNMIQEQHELQEKSIWHKTLALVIHMEIIKSWMQNDINTLNILMQEHFILPNPFSVTWTVRRALFIFKAIFMLEKHEILQCEQVSFKGLDIALPLLPCSHTSTPPHNCLDSFWWFQSIYMWAFLFYIIPEEYQGKLGKAHTRLQ